MALSGPKRRRWRKLIIILGRESDWTGMGLLCIAWPIYEVANDAALTTPQKAVVDAIDAYYLAYDPQDSESFNECAAGTLSANDKGNYADAIDEALNQL
jgi:hypothetical protein